MARKRVLISGRVQGVYFRAYTLQEANRLGLVGWVRNLPDGRVEALFEGPDEAVEQMLSWCRTGSPNARVTNIEIIDDNSDQVMDNFTITG